MPMSMCSTQDSLPQDSGPGPKNGHVKLAAVLSVVPFLSAVGKMLDLFQSLMFAKDQRVEMIRTGLRGRLSL